MKKLENKRLRKTKMKKEGEKSANLYTGGKKEIEKVIRVPSKSFIRNPEI